MASELIELSSVASHTLMTSLTTTWGLPRDGVIDLFHKAIESQQSTLKWTLSEGKNGLAELRDLNILIQNWQTIRRF